MRIFVTGATGFVGSAVVRELLNNGYEVLGLARSEAGVQSLAEAGVKAHRGDLQDLESLKAAAAASDGVIHTAFVHDFSRFEEVCEIDRRAIAALGEALSGSNKPLIVTSGLGMLKPGGLATEADAPGPGFPRKSEAAAEAAVKDQVKGMTVRLAPSVHGAGDHGFVPRLIAIAREKGASAYVGDGSNLWAGVHRLDAARLYRLTLEKGIAGGRYHGAADEGVPFRDLAEVIGRRLNVPVVSKTPQEANDHFGWMARFAGMDIAASSKRTQEELGWTPKEAGLIADIDQPYYFAAKS